MSCEIQADITMEKALTYCRVSTEEQAKENHHSLDAQKRICGDFALREGYKVIKIFEDAGKSATTIKGRPALNDMLAYIEEQNDIKAVFVQDTDRLARNTQDHLAIKAMLIKNSVKLISVSQPGIDDSAEGNMMDTILASVNQFQSDITKRKTLKGLEQKALSGWKPGEAPLGYKNVEDEDGNKIIVIDEKTAPFVKEAFELYISGYHGAKTINQLLYKKGFRSKRRKNLANSKLYYLLENPFYYGEFVYNGKTYAGKHEPIISKETFDLAQKIKETRTERKCCKRKHSFLLSGYIYCHCSRKFTAETHTKPSGRVYSYYHCTRGKECTETKSIPTNTLEDKIQERFKEVQFTEDFYNKLIAKLKEYYGSHKQEVKKEVNQLIKQKLEVEKKREKLEQLLFESSVDKEMYKRNNDKFNTEIAVIEGEIKNLKQRKNIEIYKFEEIAGFAKNVYKTYKQSELEVKRMYLGFFWEKFVVKGDSIIDAVPTALFKALQEIQKPPIKEVSAIRQQRGDHQLLPADVIPDRMGYNPTAVRLYPLWGG